MPEVPAVAAQPVVKKRRAFFPDQFRFILPPGDLMPRVASLKQSRGQNAAAQQNIVRVQLRLQAEHGQAARNRVAEAPGLVVLAAVQADALDRRRIFGFLAREEFPHRKKFAPGGGHKQHVTLIKLPDGQLQHFQALPIHAQAAQGGTRRQRPVLQIPADIESGAEHGAALAVRSRRTVGKRFPRHQPHAIEARALLVEIHQQATGFVFFVFVASRPGCGRVPAVAQQGDAIRADAHP